MRAFEYYSPQTVEEATGLLSDLGNEAKAIAGGTDLVVRMHQRRIAPKCVVDLGSIEELDYIKLDEGGNLRIGVLATVHAVESSEIIKEKFEVLAEGAHSLGSRQVRNRATIAGNLCNAAPSADTAPPLIVLGASVVIAGPDGERTVLVEEFFTGPGATVLKKGEIVKEIVVPRQPCGSAGSYFKVSRRNAMDLAIVGVAALVTVDPSKTKFEDVKIALGAVAPTPVRARRAEEVLLGNATSDELILKAAETASVEAKPIADVRASKEYRVEMVNVMTKRALKEAISRAACRK